MSDNPYADLLPGGGADNPYADLLPSAAPSAFKAQPGAYGDENSVAVFADEATPKSLPDDLIKSYNSFSHTAKSADDLVAFGQQHGFTVPLKEARQFIVARDKAKGNVASGVSYVQAPQPAPPPEIAAEQADIAQSDGMFDRLGDLWSRGGAGVEAGAFSLGAALHDANAIRLPWQSEDAYLENLGGSRITQLDLRQKAAMDRALAGTPIEGEMTFDNVNSPGSLGQFVFEQGVQSLPGMATAIASLPAYIAANTGNIAQQRAANDGREDASLGDVGIAAPAGIASGIAERAGIESILHPGAGNIATRIGKAALGEGATEGAQTGIEYTGSNLGTDAGIDAGQMLSQMAAASVAGAGIGGGIHPIVSAVEAAPGAVRAANDAATGLPALMSALALEAPAPTVPNARMEPVSQPLLAPRQAAPEPVAENPYADIIQPSAVPPEGQPVDPQPAVPTQADDSGGLGQPAVPASQPQELGEGEKFVRTPAGNKVRTRMEVVDASTLNKATGDLQNRDRSRDTTDLQVQDIISKFDPELLGDDPSSDRGAPIIGQDHTVLSGNGRMLALNKIYEQHPEKAAAYRQFIESQGHSTDGIERPVLIRRVAQDMTPEEARQFVVESNKDTKLELSPVERARSDADAVTPDMLGKYAGGDLNSTANQGFVADFTKSLTAGELGNVIGSDRRLTTPGIERIENAVVAKAYDHPKLLEKLMESANNEIRAITSSLANVAPAWAKMRAAAKGGEIGEGYDITNDLADASMRVAEARNRGTKPADILTQIDAFDRPSPMTEALIEAFYTPGMKRAASVKSMTQLLQDYIDEANAQKPTTDIFGESNPGKAPLDILKELLRQRENRNGESLFDAPTKESAHDYPAQSERQPSRSSSVGDDPDDPNGTGASRRLTRPDSGDGRVPAHSGPDGDAGSGSPRLHEGSPEGHAGVQPGVPRGEASVEGSAPRHARQGSVAGMASAAAKSSRLSDADASTGNGRDNAAADRDAPSTGRPDELLNQRRDRGAYQPSFEEASFTSRQSAYSSAIQALGLSEDKFNLLPPQRKTRLLIDALDKLTGIKVTVPANMPLQYAIDQMLDAHQTLQGMARVLGIAPRALSLGGTLKLKLVKGANFLGSYNHGEAEITLPKRSNSFSHEWGHALDYHLLDQVSDAEARGLSALVREEGGDFQPSNVSEAFVNLMNAMFFDGAEIATKIMRLQASIEKTGSAKQKAAMQTQIDNILSGRSRAKEKSRYWQGANAMNKMGGHGDYWTRPTEMLARSFEAWIGFKLANEGLGSEFIGKGDGNYLSDSEERFRLTFPKDDERVRIFDAFQKVVDQLNLEHMIDTHGEPSIEAASGFNDVATPAQQQAVRRSAGRARNILSRLIGPDVEAIDTWFHNRSVDKEESSRRAGDPVKAMSKLNNLRALGFSAAADGVKMVADRWGSKAVRAIHDHFAFDLGGTRHVTRTWERSIEMRTNAALNPVFTELEKIGGKGLVFKKLTREQRDVLAKLLNGKDVADDMGLTPLASAMRKAFNDEWYQQRNAALDIGYVRDAGYLNRQIDRELVAGDPQRFTEQARQVYEHVFDRDIGEDAESIAADPERLAEFATLAKRFGLEGYKELRAAMKEDGEGDPAELVGEMLDQVRSAFALQSAAEYRDAILHQETFADYTPTSKLPSSEKKRTLPGQADELLRDFYNPDPVSAIVHYMHNSVRRTEWNKRFGRPAGAKKSAPTIAQQLDEQMAREGVPASDRAYVWDLVDLMSGRYRRTGILANPGVVNFLGFLRVKGALNMLGRAFTLSTFEPQSLGLVTGNVIHGAKALAKTWAGFILKGQRHEMMEFARARGFIRHHLLEQFSAMDRFGTTADTPTRFDKYAAGMFRNSGLTFLTNVSDAAIVDVGRRSILNEMAHRVINGGARGQEAANLMRELGIRDPDTFAQQLVDMGDALPSDEWLAGPEGFDYNTALDRLHFMTIQKPGNAEVAPLSRNPFMSYASYSITGFMQSAYRHLLKRNIKRGLRLARDHQWMMLGLMAAGTTLSAIALYLEQFMSSVAREYAWNPDRQDRWEAEGTWWQNNAALAASRTFSLGWFDQAINAADGLKYNRDLAYAPLGAYAGNDIKSLTDIGKASPMPTYRLPFVRAPGQSRKTNAGEYNAIKGLYNLAVAPSIAAVVSAVPGGPIASGLGGAVTATATGPIAAEKAATAIVGPKEGSIGPDGKKIKSGPTGYDKLLDDVFGEVKRKKRGS